MKTPTQVSEVAIVLPAYNEEKDLPTLLDNIRGTLAEAPFKYTVVVVDDGSKDNTAAIARAAAKTMPLKLIQHEVNKGLGEGVQTGLSAGRHLGEVVVVMDADNTHNPVYIQDMVRVIQEGDADVVIASRFRAASVVQGVPFFRQVLSWGCFAMMKCLLPYRNVRDYSTGFRAYRSLTLGRLIQNSGARFIEESSFACMLELLLSLRWLGARAVEIPYTLRYDLKVGASKMRIIRTIRRYFHVIGKYWCKDVLPETEETSLSELRRQLRTQA
ncbi:MAG: glycosyltransferase family 2 protein [Prosthecobacter sp.]|uniref:glycosyltransferase family 2 protein n=1 Tax=Prosthecobacter sp. TaxID=1965333 RepID=UPI0025D6E72E|nr:glycosyltransferase family 2 protein [Prosthecobacter sp.]MCF7787847.1 glycosyltransferase family 2 protein [Prosthecobacter sp.]